MPVAVYLDQHVEGQSHRCFATNLSTTGVYMERPIASFVRHSADVQLEIPLPDDEGGPVWASAEVVYDCFDALFHGTALRFKTLGKQDSARLERWLQKVSMPASAGLGSAAA